MIETHIIQWEGCVDRLAVVMICITVRDLMRMD